MSEKRELTYIAMEAIDPRFQPRGASFDGVAFLKRYPFLVIRRERKSGSIAFMADVSLAQQLAINPNLLHAPAPEAEASAPAAEATTLTVDESATMALVIPLPVQSIQQEVPADYPLVAGVAL
jgi:hypothetical protein